MNSSPKAWDYSAWFMQIQSQSWRRHGCWLRTRKLSIIPKVASERECVGARSTGSFLKVPGQVPDGQLVEPVVAVHRRRRLPHRWRWRRWRRRHHVPAGRWWRRHHVLMRPRHDRPHGGKPALPPRVAAAPSLRRRGWCRRLDAAAMSVSCCKEHGGSGCGDLPVSRSSSRVRRESEEGERLEREEEDA
jgi:hypothetical protein